MLVRAAGEIAVRVEVEGLFELPTRIEGMLEALTPDSAELVGREVNGSPQRVDALLQMAGEIEDVPRGLAQFTLRPPAGAQPVVTPSIEL